MTSPSSPIRSKRGFCNANRSWVPASRLAPKSSLRMVDLRSAAHSWRCPIGTYPLLAGRTSDETISGHRLHDKGLGDVVPVGAVEERARIKALEQQYRVHSAHGRSRVAHQSHCPRRQESISLRADSAEGISSCAHHWASSSSSLAKRLSVSLAVAPFSSAAKSRKSASSHMLGGRGA